jgi:hypothetical protein
LDAGTVSLLPVMILFVLLEPFLVSGLTKRARGWWARAKPRLIPRRERR